jgi:predicted nucleic acid-binding protein
VDDLPDGALVALDTMAFIYFTERNQKYHQIVRPVFEKLAAGRIEAHASVISLVEVLVLPISRGDAALQQDYRELLTFSQLRLHLVDESIAEVAAQIRATDLISGLREDQALRVGDSIVVATGLASGCGYLVTNDRKLRRVAGIQVLLIEDYV